MTMIARWEIDIDCKEETDTEFVDPIKVARAAREIQLKPESIATVFHIIDRETEKKYRVDLTEIDSAGCCMRCGETTDDLTTWPFYGKVCSNCENELTCLSTDEYKEEISYVLELMRINSDSDLDQVERQIKEAEKLVEYWKDRLDFASEKLKVLRAVSDINKRIIKK